MIKVSVVVPTYQTPPEGLDRLMRSLDRQTMPVQEFEVIFVDDGSPDDTPQRLEALASTRSNVRVEVIENSGWPSKPRNVGLELATGEYIAFMDHDDELYPDALRAAYDFAIANDSDVVNGKESRTTEPSWAVGNYDEDRPNAVGRADVHPLLPMNPHKLYRRDFLGSHGIRFIEGRRVFWEDIFFNLQVARHARVISSLASTPYYHWVTTEGSGSTTFIKSADEYWDWLERVCEATQTELAGAEHAQQRLQLELHQYSTRVLGVFDKKYATRSEANRRRIFERSRTIQASFDYQRLDERLPAFRRVRAELLRAGRRDLLTEICVSDAAVPGWGSARSIGWRDGKLVVTADVEWLDSDGRRPRFAHRGDRIHKVISPAAQAVVSDAATDVTDALSRVELGCFIHSRRSRVAWSLPAAGDVAITDDEWGGVSVRGTVSTEIDLSTAAAGQPLDPTTHWDLFVHTRLDGTATDRRLRSDIPASVSAGSDGVHLVYPNDGGYATLIPHGQTEAVRRLLPVSVEEADGDLLVTLSGEHDGRGRAFARVGELVIDTPDDSVDTPDDSTESADSTGDSLVDAQEDVFEERDAPFEVQGGIAKIRVPKPDGSSVSLRIGDRAKDGVRWWNIVRSEGEFVLEPGPRPQPPAEPVESTRPAAPPSSAAPSVPSSAPTLRRTAGKILRRLGLR